MKKHFPKQAQVYGLSSFIYALAIAVVLLVSLIGMSKEFETKSHAATYEGNAVIVSRTAENVKKILEEERRYALDKSLYFTGAYGGSDSFGDSQKRSWGTGCGTKDNTMLTYLPEKQIPYWYSSGTNCVPSDDAVITMVTRWTQIFAKPDSDCAQFRPYRS